MTDEEFRAILNRLPVTKAGGWDLMVICNAIEAATLERAASLCDRFAARDMHPAECAAAIRALGEVK
jgi:hypothetical protein